MTNNSNTENLKVISEEVKLISPNIPDLGEVEEAEVIEICVEIGQKVESEDPIMVLETDKAAMEIPASVDGIIKSYQGLSWRYGKNWNAFC